MRDKDAAVRLQAALVIGKTKPNHLSVVSVLIESLKEKDARSAPHCRGSDWRFQAKRQSSDRSAASTHSGQRSRGGRRRVRRGEIQEERVIAVALERRLRLMDGGRK